MPSTQQESKVAALCTRLHRLALELGPESKLPTTRELCELFDTNWITLREALDILEAQNILSRKQSRGIFVSPKVHRKTICVLLDASLIIDPGASPFWSILWGLVALEGQQRSLQRDEYYSFHLVVQTSSAVPALPEDVVAMIESRKVHGVLAIGLENDTATWLKDLGIPYVTFAMAPGYGSVLLDIAEMIRLAVGALAEQGCRDIGFWMFTHPNDSHAMDRQMQNESTLQAALAEHRLEYNARLFRSTPLIPSYVRSYFPLEDLGYRLATELVGTPAHLRPDGLVIADDLITRGALVALQKSGLHVGKDIQIATHANTRSSSIIERLGSMTFVEFDTTEIVNQIFALLDNLLALPEIKERTVLIAPRIRTQAR